MTLRHTGLMLLFFLIVYPMWVTGGTQTAWQLPLPLLAALLLGTIVLVSHRRLWRDPITFLGGAFLLLLIQWWNSPRPQVFDSLIQAWVFAPPPVPFLPSAVSRPDAAEMLRWFFPVWTIALAARHLDLRETLTTRRFLNAILIAAALLAFGSIIQFAIATQWNCGTIPSKSYFVTSFGYGNQAGSFFVLCFSIAIGFMLSTLLHRQPVRAKVWSVLCSLLMLGGGLISLSRSAIILSLIVLAFTALYVLTFRIGQTSRATRFNRLMATLAIATAAFLAIYPLVGDSVVDELSRRYPETAELCLPANWTHSALENIRPIYREIAVKVLRDNFWFGAGGWAVRHLGIIYLPLKQHSLLQTEGAANTHNDTLQFLSEFGVLGMALLWTGIGVIATPLIRHWRTLWNSPRTVFNILGLLAITIHSNFDIPFRSPAILFLWTLVLCLTAQEGAAVFKRQA